MACEGGAGVYDRSYKLYRAHKVVNQPQHIDLADIYTVFPSEEALALASKAPLKKCIYTGKLLLKGKFNQL